MSTAKKYAKKALPWAVIAVLSGTYYWHTYGQTDSAPRTAGRGSTLQPQRIDDATVGNLRQIPLVANRGPKTNPPMVAPGSKATLGPTSGNPVVEQAARNHDWSVDGFQLTIPSLANQDTQQTSETVIGGAAQDVTGNPANALRFPATPFPTTEPERGSLEEARSVPVDSLVSNSRVFDSPSLPGQRTRNIGSHTGQLISNPYLGNTQPIEQDSVQITSAFVPNPEVNSESNSSPEMGRAANQVALEGNRSAIESENSVSGGLASVLEQQAANAARIQSSLPTTEQANATMVSAQQPAQGRTVTPRLPEAVYQQIVHHLEYGNSLARRSATLLAKQEFTKGLRIVAELADNRRASQSHLAALQEGFTALREAEDFESNGGVYQLDALRIAEAHDTPIVRLGHFQPNTPSQARKAYLLFAQDRIVQAVKQQPVSAELLYALGKTHLVEAMYSGPSQRLDFARAAVLFQCALMVHPHHVLSANELGVILARSGRPEDAKVLFQNAIQTDQNFSEGWRNLAKVHAQLGEERFAKLATYEAEMVEGTQQPVKLVNSDQFNNSFGAWGLPEEPENDVQNGSPSQVGTPLNSASAAGFQQPVENKRILNWLPSLSKPEPASKPPSPPAEPSPDSFRRFGGF